MDLWRRLLIAAVLGGVLAGILVQFGVAQPAHEPYPSPTAIVTDYESYVGETVLLWGGVESVRETSGEARITVSTGKGPMVPRVTDFGARVSPGGSVQVYGTLAPDQTVRAQTVVVVNPAGSSRLYKYGVSALGAMLVLVQFFRHWRVTGDELGFEVWADG